jgi:hypothetical protein
MFLHFNLRVLIGAVILSHHFVHISDKYALQSLTKRTNSLESKQTPTMSLFKFRT